MNRGIEMELAMKVAKQLSVRDQLSTHMRDELGSDPASLARPMEAARISAASVAFFTIMPNSALFVAPRCESSWEELQQWQ
jgi:vacuolar iron transporter family protein